MELVPSHGGCSSTRCLRGDHLQRRYPEQWFAGQRAASGPTGGWRGLASGGARHDDPGGIVEPRWAERGGGDERDEAFGGGARMADVVNPLQVAMR